MRGHGRLRFPKITSRIAPHMDEPLTGVRVQIAGKSAKNLLNPDAISRWPSGNFQRIYNQFLPNLAELSRAMIGWARMRHMIGACPALCRSKTLVPDLAPKDALRLQSPVLPPKEGSRFDVLQFEFLS